MQLSRKQKLVLDFFWHFLNLDALLNVFKKKMTFIADVFLNFQTPKNVARYMSKKYRFGVPFNK